jgi:hypothetical protein
MSVSGCESVFNRDTISRYNNMYFETIKRSPLGSIVTTIFLAFGDAAVRDTNVMAKGYRKTVNTVSVAYIQRFDGFSCVEEKFRQQFTDLVHPAIEATFAQHPWHQAGRTYKTDGGFDAPFKIHGRYRCNGNDFKINYFTIFLLFVAHTFQYIVKKTYIATVFVTMVNLFLSASDILF